MKPAETIPEDPKLAEKLDLLRQVREIVSQKVPATGINGRNGRQECLDALDVAEHFLKTGEILPEEGGESKGK